MKESYEAQNDLELKLLSGLSHHPTQNQELSYPKKKMDIKADYAQLPPGPASGRSPEFLAPAV